MEHNDLVPFSQEQIEDGGHLRMDDISHACAGHSLSHTHHDGRFLPTTYLILDRVSLILEKFIIQIPTKCKIRNLIWEDGSPHGRSTRMRRRRHPQVIEWMGMMSKELGGYLQIYDTRQQEAWLRWLLLKEFGHHLANTLPKSRRLGKRRMDTCIIKQR